MGSGGSKSECKCITECKVTANVDIHGSPLQDLDKKLGLTSNEKDLVNPNKIVVWDGNEYVELAIFFGFFSRLSEKRKRMNQDDLRSCNSNILLCQINCDFSSDKKLQKNSTSLISESKYTM